jgi:molybdenum cofactor biosynthesis enzyme MoaA
MPDFEYSNTRRVGFTLSPSEGTAIFLPVCQTCGRYVKMDKTIGWSQLNGLGPMKNATCKKCGRIRLTIEAID